MLTAQPFAATPRTDSSVSGSSHSDSLGKKPEEEADAQGWATASTTLLSLKSLCGGGVPSSHPSLGLSVFFLSFFFLFLLRRFTSVAFSWHGAASHLRR